MKKKIISGIQASGFLHIGNYLGAMVNWIDLQDSQDCMFFIADLHAITIDKSAKELQENIYLTIATYLACGIDPKKVTIFAQSHVSAHAELTWILSCVTPMGWLKRMTQFKTKAAKDKEEACAGLFMYPTLMAADILLYDAEQVPVGADQKQHLELTRDLAELVNKRFDTEIFKVPEPLILGKSTRIMSLQDGRVKMSKSDWSDRSRINLRDSEFDICEKIKKAKTDNVQTLGYDPVRRFEITNLINIFSDLSGQNVDEIVHKYHSLGFARFKDDLAEIVKERILPISNKINDYMNNKDYLTEILREGAIKASERATPKLDLVKKHFGFII
jgi:tryptophanyl-tRNA synthetase